MRRLPLWRTSCLSKWRRPLPENGPPGVILALDVGNRRTGSAACDALRIAVRPLETWQRGPDADEIARVGRLVDELRAVAVVVGHPLLPSGDRGEQALSVEAFVAALAQALDVPIEMWDESYTTLAAAERLDRRGRSKVGLDAAAAAVILEEYLRHLENVEAQASESRGGNTV
jgi:putative holliday junction resolvase